MWGTFDICFSPHTPYFDGQDKTFSAQLINLTEGGDTI